MNKEDGVHGSQQINKSTPGVVTVCVIDDDMLSQGWSQTSCITWSHGGLVVGVCNHPHKVLQSLDD